MKNNKKKEDIFFGFFKDLNRYEFLQSTSAKTFFPLHPIPKW
jgi:hypothetical protein